jgi:hypothetical protein
VPEKFYSILQLKLDDLMLSEHAKKKMIEIAGSRYVQVGRNNVIRLVGKRYMYMYSLDYQHRYEWKGLWCSSTAQPLSTDMNE